MKKQPEPVTRENLLSILSDEEVATVGTPTTVAQVVAGDEYIDLAAIDRGVQRAAESQRLNDVLVKRSVQENTWRKIVTNLNARRLMNEPPTPPPSRQS
jgi:hypothetical protein